MCTYNGMSYLVPQLQSLLNQERKPDQIVIFDDGSDDGTWEFLETWAAQAPIPVSVHRHAIRKGVVKNFEAAVQALDTDLIFLCDQDDVWLPNKIGMMAQVFESSPDVLLLHTDAQLVDADASDLKVSLFNALGLSDVERKCVHAGDAFSMLCRRNLVTGATAAFRRSLLNVALPFPQCYLHDEWLAILAAAIGRVDLLEVPTIQYRQHGRNQVGMALPGAWRNVQQLVALFKLPAGDFQAKRVVRSTALLERLQAQLVVPRKYVDIAKESLAYACFRASLPVNPVKRMWAVSREVRKGRYHRLSSGLRNVLRDILNR